MSDTYVDYSKFRMIHNHPEIGVGRIIAAHPETIKISGCVTLDLTSDLILGDWVEISTGVQIFTHRHHWNHSRALRKDCQTITSVPLLIDTDVFIGVSAIILGVEFIGMGAVIGAGSIVTKNVPAWEIWAGNPARKIGVRKELNGGGHA